MNHEPCPLCRREIAAEPQRYFELTLCKSCHAGEFPHPMEGLACEINVRYQAAPHEHNPDNATSIEVVGQIAEVMPLKLRAQPRSWRAALVEAFGGKIRTGDEIFDDAICVRAKRTDLASQLLSSEAVRTSLIDCTNHGRVSIVGRAMFCFRQDAGLTLTDVNDTVRGVLVVMHRLQQLPR